jgi:hypothetical protein
MLPWLFFSDAKPCVGPLVRSMERQHDIGFGNAMRDKIIGNPTLSGIVLNPNLTILDIDMDKAAIYPLLLLPANGDKLIMVADRVKEELSFDIAIRWLQLTILLQDLLNITAVVI